MTLEEEYEYAYDDYADFDYLEGSVSEAVRIMAWSAVVTLLAVGLLLMVAL